MEKKKSHGKLIGFIVIVVLIAGCGAFGWYIKKKLFNTDYVACYDKIAKVEKAYRKKNLSKPSMKTLKKLVKKTAPKAKVIGETKNTLKLRYYCDYEGVVTFFFNGNEVMGRCAKHEAKYLENHDHAMEVYRHAIYIKPTFTKGVKLNNRNLQEAVFWYESGRKYGSYPQVIINGKHYACVPYYDQKNDKIIVIGVTNTNPYNKTGTTIREVTRAQAIFDADHDRWYLGDYDMTKNPTPSGQSHQAKDYQFVEDDDD